MLNPKFKVKIKDKIDLKFIVNTNIKVKHHYSIRPSLLIL